MLLLVDHLDRLSSYRTVYVFYEIFPVQSASSVVDARKGPLSDFGKQDVALHLGLDSPLGLVVENLRFHDVGTPYRAFGLSHKQGLVAVLVDRDVRKRSQALFAVSLAGGFGDVSLVLL